MAKDKKTNGSTETSSPKELTATDTQAEEVIDQESKEQSESSSSTANELPGNKTSTQQEDEVLQARKQDIADDALSQLKAKMDAENIVSEPKTRQTAKNSADKKNSEPTLKSANAATSTQATSKTSTTTNNTTSPTTPSKTMKTKRSWLAFFAFLLSLAAAAGVGFLWWQSQIWLKNQEQVEQLKQQTMLNNQQTISQLQSRVTELQNAQTKQVSNYDVVQQSLNAYASRINELGQSQPNFWLAAESKYLINLAERRLLIEQDVDTAIQLLLDANQRLTAMQDPSVFHIRSAISEDVASLYALATPNTDDVYLSLSGLINEVQHIKFAQAYIPQPLSDTNEQETVSEDLNDWQQNLMISIKRFFGHFITITKRDAQVQPQLPAEQQWFVRSNLTTQLLMAQAATLDQHPARFNDAIEKLQLWTAQYFDNQDARVAAFMTTLNSLSQTDVGLELPTGLSSQALISNYVTEQLALKHSDSEVKANDND